MQRPIEGNYTLKYPIPNGDQPPITELVILRPKGKDRRVIDRYLTPTGGFINPMGLQLEMIERLCRMPNGGDIYAGFADELDDEDVEALGKLVTPDLPSGQGDWRDALGVLAARFHWSPRELLELEWDEVLIWLDQAEWTAKGGRDKDGES